MYAFFDVDETILRVKSMFDILPFIYKETGEKNLNYDNIIFDIKKMKDANFSRSAINYHYYGKYAGVIRADVIKACARWHAYRCESPDTFMYAQIVALLKHEQFCGKEVVLVSGSSTDILSEIAAYLNVSKVLATELEIDGNSYTGKIRGYQMIGEGKVEAIRDFLTKNRTSPDCCSAYGDHSSDAGMLSYVGESYVVGENRELVALAKNRGWNIIDPETGKYIYKPANTQAI